MKPEKSSRKPALWNRASFLFLLNIESSFVTKATTFRSQPLNGPRNPKRRSWRTHRSWSCRCPGAPKCSPEATRWTSPPGDPLVRWNPEDSQNSKLGTPWWRPSTKALVSKRLMTFVFRSWSTVFFPKWGTSFVAAPPSGSLKPPQRPATLPHQWPRCCPVKHLLEAFHFFEEEPEIYNV